MTPSQALADAAHLVQTFQSDYNCGPRGTPTYCPVITVGGSYPGFLSFAMRLQHSDVIDGAYAASAPVNFYSQKTPQSEYYNLVTKSAELSLSGCAEAIQSALSTVHEEILAATDFEAYAVSSLNVCPDVPSYITTASMFADELFMVIGYTFANLNMANYPPTNATGLFSACSTFADSTLTESQKAATLLSTLTSPATCFSLSSQLPAGLNATVSSGDWSGVGSGADGEMWDFQTCSLLVESIGYDETSMFPPREWTMDWLTDHCKARFDVTPDPLKLATSWGFDDLESTDLTRVLFTNGLNDGWSVGSIVSVDDIENAAERELVVMNFPNGAHHSDLAHSDPSGEDTVDIQKGHADILQLMGRWLQQIKEEYQS